MSLLRPALVAASSRLIGPGVVSHFVPSTAAAVIVGCSTFRRQHSSIGADSIPTFDEAHMRRVKQMLSEKNRLKPTEAVEILGQHWGASIVPGEVLSGLTAKQLTNFLNHTTSKTINSGVDTANDNNLLKQALYVHAESVSSRFFGDTVYQRGVFVPSLCDELTT
jgi:hypothetical protein